MNPEFLTLADVLDIHADQIERYGGSADLRDAGLLISAVETPRATFNGAFLHTDLPEHNPLRKVGSFGWSDCAC